MGCVSPAWSERAFAPLPTIATFCPVASSAASAGRVHIQSFLDGEVWMVFSTTMSEGVPDHGPERRYAGVFQLASTPNVGDVALWCGSRRTGTGLWR